jgi:3-methyl-2-oxobutanoate hydroxymethyltransferase
VMEVVPADLAKKITHDLSIPTIGIGAGVECDAQVLVWQDMAGLRAEGKPAKFVKQYADVAQVLTDATHRFAAEVQAGLYPGAEHSYH